MCGIIAYYKIEPPKEPKYLTHRGPDEQITKKHGNCTHRASEPHNPTNTAHSWLGPAPKRVKSVKLCLLQYQARRRHHPTYLRKDRTHFITITPLSSQLERTSAAGCTSGAARPCRPCRIRRGIARSRRRKLQDDHPGILFYFCFFCAQNNLNSKMQLHVKLAG